MVPSADSTVQHDVYVNLEYNKDWQFDRNKPAQWRRVVFHVADVDEIYDMAIDAGILTGFAPSDILGGELYFHVIDPAGHELSFAKRYSGHPRWDQ
jgi:hypothetical protein